MPVTEEDRSSGLSPRELAGNIHGWQDAEGQYHVLISAGNEIFWIRWSGGNEIAGEAAADAEGKAPGPAAAAAEEKTPGPAAAAAEEKASGPAAVLVSGKWDG